jgi:diamine N-acetyltransferase
MPGPQVANESVEIVPAGPEHLGEIARLADLVWRAHYPAIIGMAQVEYMLERMYDLKVLRAELAQGICYDRLFADGQLRAFAGYGPHGRDGEMKLYKLYVHPASQRKGYGSRLISHVEEKARQRGLKVLLLTVNKGNHNAVAAYKKNGFTIRETGVIDIGGGFVMDDYIMVKSL